MAKKVFIEHLLYWFLIALYGTSLLAKFYKLSNSWVTNYLADFLCIPIVLYISRALIRWLKKMKYFQFSFFQILFASVYFSFLFEVILPQFNDKYTADYIDAFMYLAGGGLYYGLTKKVFRL